MKGGLETSAEWKSLQITLQPPQDTQSYHLWLGGKSSALESCLPHSTRSHVENSPHTHSPALAPTAREREHAQPWATEQRAATPSPSVTPRRQLTLNQRAGSMLHSGRATPPMTGTQPSCRDTSTHFHEFLRPTINCIAQH